MHEVDTWCWFGDSMLHRNPSLNFFALTLLQATIDLFYSAKSQREFQGRLQEMISDGHGKMGAETR